MNAKYEKIGNGMVRITIEADAGEFNEAYRQAYVNKRDRIRIPGTKRPPLALVEKMYGPEVFYEDAFDIISQSLYSRALDELGIVPLSRPEVDVVQIGKDKNLIFTVETAVEPEVILGQYKGIEIDRIIPEVTELEVENAIAQLQYEASQQIPVTDRTAWLDDTANIDYEGFVDGVPFEGGNDQGFDLVLGSGAFIEGFEEQIIGHRPSEEFDIHVVFPEDYHAKELSGKPAVFRIRLNALSKTVAPDINDDFAKNFGMANLEMMKKAIGESLMEGKVKEVKTQMENAIIDIVIDNAQIELPEAMVRDELEIQFGELKERLEKNGLTFEQFLQFSDKTEEDYLEEQRPDVIKALKVRLVMEAIIKAEGIIATEEDYEAELVKYAEESNSTPDKIRAMMGETGKEYLSKKIAGDKAFDLIVNSAVIK